MTPADELLALECEWARRDLIGFTTLTFPEFDTNWHHEVYARKLEQVFSGELRRAIFCMPPQNGKSELISRRFPAWALGKNPDLRLITTSHGDKLANDMSRDVQRIMDTPMYRRIFPGTKLAGGKDDEQRTVRQFKVVGRRGYYVSAGISGDLTGRTADIGIVDDPFGDRSDAESEATRNRVWNDFISTFLNRQFGDTGRIIVTTTRWHEDDLAGRLLNHSKAGGEAWELVSFPAIAEQPLHADDPREIGDPLWPSKYPLEELERRRRYSEFEFAALFQQRPSPAEGGIIKRAWWRWYQELTGRLEKIVISWDCALRMKQTNDFTAGQAWGQIGPNAYALRMVQGRWHFPEILTQMRLMVDWCQSKWPHVIPQIIIETGGIGPEAFEEIRRAYPGCILEHPVGDKGARVQAITPLLEGHNAWLPGVCHPDGRVNVGHAATEGWVESFVEECSAFPNGAHDDQVDAMTQALRRIHRPRTSYLEFDLPGL